MCRKFSTQRLTANLRIPYYVKADFSTSFKGSLRRLEQQVEEDHVANLKSNCLHEKSYSKYLHFHQLCGGIESCVLRRQVKRSGEGVVTCMLGEVQRIE